MWCVFVCAHMCLNVCVCVACVCVCTHVFVCVCALCGVCVVWRVFVLVSEVTWAGRVRNAKIQTLNVS